MSFIVQPVGSKLMAKDLPGGSLVNVRVIKSPDGMPDLEFTDARGKNQVHVNISDLEHIMQWAQGEI